MAFAITAEDEARIEAILAQSKLRREREIAQQAKGGKRWRASFELLSGDYELHCPNWESGYGRGPTVVFVAIAESEDELMEYIEEHCLEEGSSIEWRFADERPDDYSPYSDRFPKSDELWEVWPDVPLMPMEKYLAGVRRQEIAELEAKAIATEEFKRLSVSELLKRAIEEAGVLYDEDIPELVEQIEDALRRGEKLVGG